jgi:hypothetical protein
MISGQPWRGRLSCWTTQGRQVSEVSVCVLVSVAVLSELVEVSVAV